MAVAGERRCAACLDVIGGAPGCLWRIYSSRRSEQLSTQNVQRHRSHRRRALAALSRNDFGRAPNPSDRGGNPEWPRNVNIPILDRRVPSAARVRHKKNDGHVRSDCGRLSGKPSIHQPARCRNSCFFSNTCMHILIPLLSVLCFIDVREVISAVRLPSAFVKHSFASCNIITPGRNWTERMSV